MKLYNEENQKPLGLSLSYDSGLFYVYPNGEFVCLVEAFLFLIYMKRTRDFNFMDYLPLFDFFDYESFKSKMYNIPADILGIYIIFNAINLFINEGCGIEADNNELVFNFTPEHFDCGNVAYNCTGYDWHYKKQYYCKNTPFSVFFSIRYLVDDDNRFIGNDFMGRVLNPVWFTKLLLYFDAIEVIPVS
jgi:hypothetical protein